MSGRITNDEYKEQYGDAPELIEAMMANRAFCTAKKCQLLCAVRTPPCEPGNGERIDQALHAD